LEAQAIAENEPDDQATREAVDLDQDGVMPKPPPTRTPRKPKTVVHGAVATTGESEGSDGEPVRFGAVGERGAVDLATAFTRGFPQAASADPIWARAPFGPTG